MQELLQVFDEFGFKVPDIGLNLSFNHALLGLEVRLPFYLVMDLYERLVLKFGHFHVQSFQVIRGEPLLESIQMNIGKLWEVIIDYLIHFPLLFDPIPLIAQVQ